MPKVNIIDRSVPNLPVIDWARGKPSVIVAHEVGNNNSDADGEIGYMRDNYESAFYHYIVDHKAAYMLHSPDIGGAWGAGPSMHHYAIHVELVRYKSKRKFKRSYKHYVNLIKYLADKYGIPVVVDQGTDKRGIHTHNYVRKTYGGTTHTDPVAYLQRHGVSIADFAADLGDTGHVDYDHQDDTDHASGDTTSGSIVDYLKSQGRDASFGHRKQLARRHGISGYQGTATQNTRLLHVLTNGGSSAKSISQMAQEVIDGKHGNGHAQRRKSLGVSKATYRKVRDEVNRQAGGTSTGKSISQMAQEVIDGKHGNGRTHRRKSLGVSKATYRKVQNKVNKML